MRKKKKGKPRGPYKCTLCREYGHRANKCPKAHTAETILNALPGEVALALIPEQFQVLSIVEGQTHYALLGAIEGNQKLAGNGRPSNNSMINAWTELAKREAAIPKHTIERAREARRALLQAQALYDDAIVPITLAIKPSQKARKA